MPESKFINTPTTIEAFIDAQNRIDAYIASGDSVETRENTLLHDDVLAHQNGDIARLPKEYAMTIAARFFGAITLTSAIDNPYYLNEKSLSVRQHNQLIYDDITGFYSRIGLMEWAAENYDPTQNTYAVFAVDCKKFKAVNDVLGHFKGNEALKAACNYLATLVRLRDDSVIDPSQEKRRRNTKDVVARFGGDELMLVMDFNGMSLESAQEVVDRVTRRLDTDEITVTCDDGLLHQKFGFRSGAVLIGKHYPISFNDALKQADSIERVKKQGHTNEQPVEIDYTQTSVCGNCSKIIVDIHHND